RSPAASSASSASTAGTAGTAGSNAAGGTSGGLLAATAHLFDDTPAAVIRRTLSPGATMASTPSSSPRGELDRLGSFGSALGLSGDAHQDPSFSGSGGSTDAESHEAMLARLVDAVVERLEERVIEELERRGRRYDRDVF
ncbi:MAG: hypothetical protein Q7T71_01290, partial [Herbiconiux sp.]|nr:hypothetical protein [Herbiconiux sp.]